MARLLLLLALSGCVTTVPKPTFPLIEIQDGGVKMPDNKGSKLVKCSEVQDCVAIVQ